MYANQDVNVSIKKIEEWDFAMASTETNKEHFHFGGDFKVLLMIIIYKMQIIVLKSDAKGLILGTNTDSLYSYLGFGGTPARVHLSCHLYLLSYYCPINPSYTNMFNHYMYLALEDRKSANTFSGHYLSDEWNPYHYVKESGSAVQPKEMDADTTVLKRVHSSSPLWKKLLKSPRMMIKPSKMKRMFKWKFPMQQLKKN